MKLIVRYVEAKGVGKETHEVHFEGERASIGRGTDQSIQIPDRRIPLAHSALHVSGDGLLLKAESGCSFTVNDHVSRSAELNDGDVVDVLGHQIRVLPGEGDAEHIVEVDIEESTIEPLRERFTTRLKQLNFPQRKLAWFLFLSIIVIGILIPSAGFFIGMDVLRNSPLPDDGLWLTGELHHTHAFTGDDCGYCHSQPFTPVRDVDCLACHLSVNHHFDASRHGVDDTISNRCGVCHKEHSGPEAMIRRDQAVCTGCHEDLAGVGLASEVLRPVTDFLTDHPTFRVSMKALTASGEWAVTRSDLWQEDLAEHSNLLFPHDLHLDRDGIDSADGTVVMECSHCHVIEKGGLRMQTVTMEKHCAGCHQLTFDPERPDRVVPHGSPEALMQHLQGYYAYQFLSRNVDDPGVVEEIPGSVQRRTRRPGKQEESLPISEVLPRETETLPRTDRARGYVERRVGEAAANLFERQTCTICHDITRDNNEDIPWQVKPVKLTDDWFPMAKFSHVSHKNMQCASCHEAEASPVATDVLIPDIGSCRVCHGGEDANDRLRSRCISCHEFHLEHGQPMGVQNAARNMSNPLHKTMHLKIKKRAAKSTEESGESPERETNENE